MDDVATDVATDTSLINKTLHVVWVGPHDPPRECIDTWTAKNPGWEFVLHRDHKGWECQAQIDKEMSKREYNGAADIIRYEILHKMGGVVVDADSECVEALDDRFLAHKAWAVYENETARPGFIGCGALGAVQGSEFFKACMEETTKVDLNQPAWKSVGPMLITRLAQHIGGLHVFPARMFNPVHFSGAKAPGDDTIFAKQHWGGTKGYNHLRRIPCRCAECQITALRPPWG